MEKKQEEIRMCRLQITNLEELQKREEENETFQFLANLDSSYETLRSRILLNEDLPSFDKIVNMIQRERESRQVVMNTQPSITEEAKVFATYQSFNANPRPTMRGEQGIQCEYCKKDGHKKEECWCFHPHLRPKGLRRSRFNKGSNRR
jgi:hypothetical protein